jgi:hypothetical protein
MNFGFLKPEKYDEWNDFVDRSPQGSIFAKTFYLDALGALYKIAVLRDGGEIQGGIILSKNEIGVYSNPLLAKYLGILVRPTEGKYVNRLNVEKQIVEEIVSNIEWSNTFDYTFHPAFKNWLPFYWKGYRQEVRYTYRIENLSQLAKVWQGVESRVRKNMRKAKKCGIIIKEEVPPKIFYNIWEATFKKQGGSAPVSYALFEKFWTGLSAQHAIKILAAVDQYGRYHAVSGIVYDAKTSFLLFNGMDGKLPNYEANTLLVLESIEFASKVSKSFDFEGSMLQPVERFYRGFGGTLTSYYNIWKGNLFNSLKRGAIKTYKKLKYGQ